MENPQAFKQTIDQAKHICLVCNQHEPESVSCTLALFYTLKQLGKNATVLIDDIPEKLNFLIPSLDFIALPKNFVLSIPRKVANVTQVYYEKSEEALNIHLNLEQGTLKKEDIVMYATNQKPDLVMTVGIQDFKAKLESLDSYGFLLDTPLINIDNHGANQQFGKINIVATTSLAEVTLSVIRSLTEATTPEAAECLLAGLVLHYENFKSRAVSSEAFALAAALMKQGADYHRVATNISRVTEKENQFTGAILQQAALHQPSQVFVASLNTDDYYNYSEHEAATAVERIKMTGTHDPVLALWKSHASAPMIKGFFYSTQPRLINKFSEYPHSKIKNGWVFLAIPGEDLPSTTQALLSTL